MLETEMNKPLVEIKGLKEYFSIPQKGMLHAVDGISFSIAAGETLGLVGESGCGKSTVGNVVVRLLKPTEGKVLYNGEDVFESRGAKSLSLRKAIQMIFQDPYSSINPAKTIYQILSEPYLVHGTPKGETLDRKIRALIQKTGLEGYVLEKFPHELDGGRRQLVGIARCLSLEPRFIVCDEPVSALDVSIQATIINLLMDMQKEMGISYLFISHDLSVVKHISHRIAVMYLGKIVEIADKKQIFENTLHPYSIALLSAVPQVEFNNQKPRIVLKGDVPSPINPGKGCRFANRCWLAREKCFESCPELTTVETGHMVACHYCQENGKNGGLSLGTITKD